MKIVLDLSLANIYNELTKEADMLDTLLLLAGLNVFALGWDGASTAWRPEGMEWKENAIASKIIGRRPTWETMIPAGIAEVAIATTCSYVLKRTGWRGWWIPQASISIAHFLAGTSNLSVKIQYNYSF